MKRIAKNLLEALYFMLCFAAVPIIAGSAILDDGFLMLALCAAVVPLGWIISLLPGHVGGRKKQETVYAVRRAAGNDPDPDRMLRRDSYDPDEKNHAFPLRAVLCGLLTPAVAAAVFCLPNDAIRAVSIGQKLFACVLPAAVLPVSLKFCTSDLMADIRNASIGIVLYLIAGTAANLFHLDSVKTGLTIGGSLFIVLALFMMNNQAMRTGTASLTGTKPPQIMRKRNRMLLIGMMVLTALVAGFDWLREHAILLGKAVLRLLWTVFWWFTTLLDSGEEVGSGGGGGGGIDMSELSEGATTSAFWDKLTYVGYVIAVLAILYVLYLMFRRIWEWLKILYRKLADSLGHFAQSVGEDYSDEQESLLDWDETRREMSSRLKKRVTDLFRREKKWEQMDGCEKSRYLVKTLYRRSHIEADCRTLREVMPDLKVGDPETLTKAYESARYADRAPADETLDRLRKDIRA